MAKWYKWNREFRTGQTIWRVVMFFFFFFNIYMYLSYIFYFKESTIITTEKQKEKQTQKLYRHEEDKSLPILVDYVRIQVVVLKTCLGRWTIGRSGERGSGISVLPARYDDDDVLQETKFSLFFQLILNLNQYPFVSFTIKGREPPRSPRYLFSYFFPLSRLLAKNKSLSSSHLKWI